MSMSCRCFWQ